ncbi:MAG: phytanoyl-CoA dioxygenase family protein [Geminicoccaceae bacterium]
MSVMTSDSLRADFARDGYVAVRPLFDGDKIRELKTEVARYIRDVVPTMPDARVYYEDKNDLSSLKQVQKLFEYDNYFADLMNGTIRGMAETVLEDDVVPVNMQYFDKPAGIGQATPPHQDGYYFHLTPSEAVTGWLALDDVDEDNGCIHYVRGSHRTDRFRPHGQTGVLGFSQGITDFGTPLDKADSVAVPGPSGTFLMHHARTIHWAGPNRSKTRSRRAIGFIYYAKRAREDIASKEAYQKSLDERLRAQAKI